MKKLASVFLIFAVFLPILAGCSSDGAFEIKDGVYRAEYDSYDSFGYKDFIEITFENGEAVSVSADAVSSEDGSLKSESKEYRKAMEPLQGTYPEKYYKDLINQYIANPSSDSIDIVAGATSTSKGFKSLLKAIERSVKAGEPGTVTVSR